MEYSLNIRPSACFEILKIIEVSSVEGNSNNYKVEWAPTWVNGAHLLGCQHLIEEFLQQKQQGDASEDDGQHNAQCREYQEQSSDTFFEVIKEEVGEQYVECTNKYPNDLNLYPINEFHDDEDNNVSGERLDSVLYNNDDETCSNLPNEIMSVPNEAVTAELSHMNNLDINVTEKEHNVSSVNHQNCNCAPTIVVKSEEDIEPREIYSSSTSAIQETESQHPHHTHYFNNPSPYSKKTNMTFGVKLPTGELFTSFEDPQAQCSKSNDGKGKNAVSHHLREPVAVQEHSKALLCEICDKVFKYKSKLDRHMNIHMGLKEFHCDICSKQFSRKRNLKQHRKIHTGQKDFYCDVCSKGFIQKPNLMKHMSLHCEKRTLTTNPKLSII